MFTIKIPTVLSICFKTKKQISLNGLAYLVRRLKNEGDGIRLVLSLDCDDVIVGSAPQNLRH